MHSGSGILKSVYINISSVMHLYSCKNIFVEIYTKGRTYVIITYVSKENNLGPDDKIRNIWGLKGLIFIL